MRPAWSRSLPSAPVGLSLARESGSILVWDGEPTLGRYDRLGQRELRQRAPAELKLAAMAEDGSSVAAAGSKGQVWLLTADLTPHWERSIRRAPTALAIEHLGKRVAVADDGGGLSLFDSAGQLAWRETVPRPLVHLVFVPETGAVVGCAEFGLVCAFSPQGKSLWRDGLFAHVGALTTSGDGKRILLACFTGGLCRYSLPKPNREEITSAGACRLVSSSYGGGALLTADLDKTVTLRDVAGKAMHTLQLPASPLALTLEPLGGAAVLALNDGRMMRIEIPYDRPSAVWK